MARTLVYGRKAHNMPMTKHMCVDLSHINCDTCMSRNYDVLFVNVMSFVILPGQKMEVFRKHQTDFMKNVINIGESLALLFNVITQYQ